LSITDIRTDRQSPVEDDGGHSRQSRVADLGLGHPDGLAVTIACQAFPDVVCVQSGLSTQIGEHLDASDVVTLLEKPAKQSLGHRRTLALVGSQQNQPVRVHGIRHRVHPFEIKMNAILLAQGCQSVQHLPPRVPRTEHGR